MLSDLKTAARALGKSRRTLEMWLAKGAPFTLRRGRRLVDPDELARWRQGDPLAALARATEHVLRRDAGDGRPAWQAFGIREDAAIALLLEFYDRAAYELTGKAPQGLPAELRNAFSRLLALRQSNPQRAIP